MYGHLNVTIWRCRSSEPHDITMHGHMNLTISRCTLTWTSNKYKRSFDDFSHKPKSPLSAMPAHGPHFSHKPKSPLSATPAHGPLSVHIVMSAEQNARRSHVVTNGHTLVGLAAMFRYPAERDIERELQAQNGTRQQIKSRLTLWRLTIPIVVVPHR